VSVREVEERPLINTRKVPGDDSGRVPVGWLPANGHGHRDLRRRLHPLNCCHPERRPRDPALRETEAESKEPITFQDGTPVSGSFGQEHAKKNLELLAAAAQSK
jgi:hypothetical protein